MYGIEQSDGLGTHSPQRTRTESYHISRTNSASLETLTSNVAVSQRSSNERDNQGDQSSSIPQPSVPYSDGNVSTAELQPHENGPVLSAGTLDEQTNMDWMAFGEPVNDPFDLFGEGDAFLENVDFSSLFLPAGFGLDQELPFDQSASLSTAFQTNTAPQGQAVKENDLTEPVAEPSTISRFGSPLPSIRPTEQKNGSKQPNQRTVTFTRPAPCWKISPSDYAAMEASLAPLMPVLPSDFTLPSRHTASRFLEGCIRGTYEHMPVLHVPSFSVRSAAPDLILSMMAVGSQFKLEGKSAMALFYAAKAAIMHQLRTRVPGAMSALAQQGSPYVDMSENSSASVHNWSLAGTDVQSTVGDARLQTMQAILNLMVSGKQKSHE